MSDVCVCVGARVRVRVCWVVTGNGGMGDGWGVRPCTQAPQHSEASRQHARIHMHTCARTHHFCPLRWLHRARGVEEQGMCGWKNKAKMAHEPRGSHTHVHRPNHTQSHTHMHTHTHTHTVHAAATL